MLTIVTYKSTQKSDCQPQTKAQPQIAMIKDLFTDDVDGHVIKLCKEANRNVNHKSLPNDVGVPVISGKIGTHCYHGLCEIGAIISAIPFTICQEIVGDISPCSI